MQAHLPINYLQNLSPSVFIAKYSLLGVIFQPDEEEIAVITSLITYFYNLITIRYYDY
jgi:hypothetical protein